MRLFYFSCYLPDIAQVEILSRQESDMFLFSWGFSLSVSLECVSMSASTSYNFSLSLFREPSFLPLLVSFCFARSLFKIRGYSIAQEYLHRMLAFYSGIYILDPIRGRASALNSCFSDDISYSRVESQPQLDLFHEIRRILDRGWAGKMWNDLHQIWHAQRLPFIVNLAAQRSDRGETAREGISVVNTRFFTIRHSQRSGHLWPSLYWILVSKSSSPLRALDKHMTSKTDQPRLIDAPAGKWEHQSERWYYRCICAFSYLLFIFLRIIFLRILSFFLFLSAFLHQTFNNIDPQYRKWYCVPPNVLDCYFHNRVSCFDSIN